MTKLNGWKMGLSVTLIWAVTVIAAETQTFTSLASFDGSNGANPDMMDLVQGVDGNMYGTTRNGGTQGDGTFFKISPTGTMTTIYDFGTNTGSIINNPVAGVILADDGNFYGTTIYGGEGYGSVYKITSQGVLTVLYTFHLYPDGGFPFAPLLQGTDGSFYGTTAYGGPETGVCFEGCGTIFKLTKNGVLTTLYSFQYDILGHPESGLVQGPDLAFYGTASGGDCCAGTVFKVTANGKFTVLYYFCSQSNCTDGYTPLGGLVFGNDGDFYGTTEFGGSNGYNTPFGTVFRITPEGQLRTIYNFCSAPNCTDGGGPYTGLFQGTDGKFYGTAIVNSLGVENGLIFNVTPSGTETPLYDFCTLQNCSDGKSTYGGLLQNTNGIFYGATYGGGSFGDGTVYSLSTGLGPFVTFVRAAGKIGQTGGILGQGFTGTTSVTLNGVPAKFTVESDTFIKATVPPGATTGYVNVTTPTGVLTSNVPFHVIPSK